MWDFPVKVYLDDRGLRRLLDNEEELMTRLLEQVVAEIAKLPEDVQDAIAARLLTDLADEQAWATSFAATPDAPWGRIAAMARREIDMERRHAEGYARHPVKPGEFDLWEAEQQWGEQ